MRRFILRAALCASAVAAGFTSACAVAADYPDHPITLINPYAAGGPADVLARSLARVLEKALGQPIIVENKGGGGASIGTSFVARAKPDGYTLLLGTSAGHVVTPLMQSTKYDGIADFAFASIVANQPIMLVVNSKTGIASLSQLIEKARAHPGSFNFASAGVGGATHLAGEIFQRRAGVKLTHVPYSGAAPAINDVVGGQVELAFLNLSACLPFIRDGRLTPLAYAWTGRSPLMPDVPTMAQAGVTGAESATWYSLAAPAGTPADRVEKISLAVKAAAEDPAYKKLMAELGIDTMALTPQAATALVEKDRREMKTLLDSLGLARH